ncbi:hypothetical protein ASD97_25895 [Streptomyces sp. Root63]|nr:hypothetical protein ASD29_32200 [Streptomyces sp. Root1295]KRA34072.1 hypothetical protein ASD97_25895 [Streptomyces sp. Root63]
MFEDQAGEDLNLSIGGDMVPLLKHVPESPQVSRNHHVHRSGIRENSPGSLTSLLALKTIKHQAFYQSFIDLY